MLRMSMAFPYGPLSSTHVEQDKLSESLWPSLTDLCMPNVNRSGKPGMHCRLRHARCESKWAAETYLIRATRVIVQKIMLVAPMRSWWSGGSWKMLAKTYSGDVPTSPKMMPMALHGSI